MKSEPTLARPGSIPAPHGSLRADEEVGSQEVSGPLKISSPPLFTGYVVVDLNGGETESSDHWLTLSEAVRIRNRDPYRYRVLWTSGP